VVTNGDTQDGIDARVRAARTFNPHWHPILAAREVTPGHWVMVDTMGFPYGLVRFVRRGGEVGYRVDRWSEGDQTNNELIGYFTNLRAATMAAHKRFIDQHASEHGVLPN
jgi:hypothetical protein